jgi:hypothetical protein
MSQVAAASGAGKGFWDMTDNQARKLSDGLRAAADMVDGLWSPETGNVSAGGASRSRAAKQGVTESRGAKPASKTPANGQASKVKVPATRTRSR